MDTGRRALDRAVAIRCFGVVARGPRLVASFPCGCSFFSLLWFNFSQIAPEWQFGSSNMVLNCFKLQGNIWQLPGSRPLQRQTEKP
jgi:hypothetical protein